MNGTDCPMVNSQFLQGWSLQRLRLEVDFTGMFILNLPKQKLPHECIKKATFLNAQKEAAFFRNSSLNMTVQLPQPCIQEFAVRQGPPGQGR